MSDLKSEIQEKLRQELECIMDMLDSALAVKGTEFSALTGTIFDLLQMIDVSASGLNMAGVNECEGGDVIIQGVSDTLARLSTSISKRLHGSLSEADIDEAYALAATIHERKMAIMAKIESEIRGRT